MSRNTTLLSLALLAAASSAHAAPSNVDPTLKYTWGENIGWIDWFSAGPTPGQQGVVIGLTTMSGFAWGENVGWINFGDGTPASGSSYANITGDDFGVNIAADGRLSGYAWGENIGWINFNTFPTLGASNQHARIDFAARRLRGYAWGENIGWINLDSGAAAIGLGCPADFNGDGFLTFEDFDAFVVSFEAGEPQSDFNADGFLTFEDFDAFVAAFEAGC
jgi:hypothetical protein